MLSLLILLRFVPCDRATNISFGIYQSRTNNKSTADPMPLSHFCCRALVTCLCHSSWVFCSYLFGGITSSVRSPGARWHSKGRPSTSSHACMLCVYVNENIYKQVEEAARSTHNVASVGQPRDLPGQHDTYQTLHPK